MTLQEDVEQFRQDYEPDPSIDMCGFDEFRKQYYALLRKVAVECFTVMGEDTDILIPEELIRLMGIEKKIRTHLAWLLHPEASLKEGE